MEFDKKESWKEFKKIVYRNILADTSYPLKNRHRLQKYKDGLYETPKDYTDGVTYNDGSWLVYNTNRITSGKFRGRILCRKKNDLIEHIYGYLCFIRKVGVDGRDEMVYYAICYIISKLTFKKGMFSKSKNNIETLKSMAKSVLKKRPDDIDCDSRRDERKFCLDPKIIKGMTTEQKVRMEKMIQKKMTDKLIEKWYNPGLSVRKNLNELNKQGVKISIGRLQKWINENR